MARTPVSPGALAAEARLAELPADRHGTPAHIDLLNDLAWELALEDTERAFALAEEALGHSDGREYEHGRAAALRALGYCNLLRRQVETSMDQCRESLALFEKLDEVKAQSTVNDLISHIHMISGDFNRSLQFTDRALNQARASGYRRGEAYALSNMGIIYGELGDSRQALDYFERALALFREIGYGVGECWTLVRSGRHYLKLERWEQALENLREGQRLARRNRVSIAANLVLTGIGAAYRALGQNERALRYLRRGLRLYSGSEFSGFQSEAHLQLGLTLMNLNRLDEARGALEEGLTGAGANQDWPTAARIHECLADLLERSGDAGGALLHFRQFHELHKRIFDADAREEAHKLEIRYRMEAAEQRAELKRLQVVEESRRELERAHAEVRRLRDRLHEENRYLQEEIKLEHNFDEIVTRSENMKAVLRLVDRVAGTDSTVLIQGETGTGKELIARALHGASNRSSHPLVKVNCATLPRDLIESELFGHERGAFTGAYERRTGRFELAHGGTLFLDEVGELPLDLQPKLLRVLQEGEFERLGGQETLKVDVRVIAATNRDLDLAVRRKTFREDLYYRLNVFPIKNPPLRRREGDVPLLAKHFVQKYAGRMGRRIEGMHPDDLRRLEAYHWPGNIRELENVIERALILGAGPILRIPLDLAATPPGPVLDTETHPGTLREVERGLIERTLRDCNWIIKGPRGAARRLGMPPSTLRDRMRLYGIARKSG